MNEAEYKERTTKFRDFLETVDKIDDEVEKEELFDFDSNDLDIKFSRTD
jgi:hypothetical protein